MRIQLTAGVLGLGEAGSRFARDLADTGATVLGWDPNSPSRELGIRLQPSDREAVADSDIVFSVNSASVALEVARSAARWLRPSAVYADLNTATPSLKREVDDIISGAGALFADVALMAPVPRAGLRTPAMVSGKGAKRYAELLQQFDVPLEIVDDEAGSAATRKLLRSVFTKGMTGAVLESMATAEALGFRQWMYEEILREFAVADEGLLVRLIEGSRAHAKRRIDEMRAAASFVSEAGIAPRISTAAAEWFEELHAVAQSAPKAE